MQKFGNFKAKTNSQVTSPQPEILDPAWSFGRQMRKHLSIFIMLLLGIVPIGMAVGRPAGTVVCCIWIMMLIGWYKWRGFRFKHHAQWYSYTISGSKYGPKYITNLDTGEVTEVKLFHQRNGIPLFGLRSIMLSLIMPFFLILCMLLAEFAYLYLKYHR